MKFIKLFVQEFKEEFAKIKHNEFKKQIPNILTLSRALAPLIIIPTLIIGRLDIAIVELVFFELTDFFDGRLARKLNCVTDFGVKLDAVCDKIFTLGIMIPAIIKYPTLLINLFLEFCISYINIVSEFKHNKPKSSIIGKIKTVFLSITLVLAYLPKVSSIYVLMSAIVTFMLQIWAYVKYLERDIGEDKKKKK